MNIRLNSTRFHIGTYILQPYARTEEHIRDLANCGIDLVIGLEYDPETLDRLHAHQIGAVVSGIVPGWFGGTGDNAGLMANLNPLSSYWDAAAQFQDHPAIWGIDVGDEPSSLDFRHYGQAMELVQNAFPQQFPYLNLYPSYGMLASNSLEQTNKELGTPSYEAYLRTYCRETQTNYLCFDHYVYSSNPDRFIADLYLAATVCKETNRNLWIVLQVNSHLPEIAQSVNRLRFQAYAAMAFGVRCISWACYTAGWWHHQVLDHRGEKTPQYERLKQVNHEILNLSRVYLSYRWTDTHRMNQHTQPMDWGIFSDIQVSHGSMLVSTMEAIDQKSKYALFLCADDDPYDTHPGSSSIRFRTASCRTILVHTGMQVHPCSPDQHGWYQIHLPSCSGCLITVE